MATGSNANLFDGNVYKLRALNGGSILLPESEQALLTGTIDDSRYVNATGTVDTKDGRGYLKEANLADITYIDYATPTLASFDIGQSVTESGVTFTVDKVEFAEAETRVYYTIENSRSASVRYHEPVITMGSNTYEEDHCQLWSDSRSNMELDWTCPAESSVSGLVEYQPMDQSSFTASLVFFAPTEIKDLELSIDVQINS